MPKTKGFIEKINQIEEIPEESLLVTLDVKPLYTNILNNKEIQAVQEAYDKPRNKTYHKLSQLILNLNNFIINSGNYIQKMGYAMDTVLTPCYANL